MSRSDLIVWDLETTGRNPNTCQVTQIAAIALDGRNLKVKGEFNSEVQPLYFDDDEAIANGWGPIEAGALKVTNKNIEDLKKAPALNVVWPKFVQFIEKYNYSKTSWTAPVSCGYNIINYDSVILNRLCEMYGPYDKARKEQKLFHPIFKIDMMDNMYMWTENDPTVKSISMDNLRKRMGMSSENAHDALQDVRDTANILIKFLITHRAVYKKLKIDDCFTNGEYYV